MRDLLYGEDRARLEAAIAWFQAEFGRARAQRADAGLRDPVELVRARVKSERSMREKLSRRGLAPTRENALRAVFDAAGARVICPFFADVYEAAAMARGLPGARVVEEKDYIASPKPNGYRSYHIILAVPGGVYLEVQLRSMAMDLWASVEHRLKYKREIPNQRLLVEELKRCADEIASTDLTLQTIRDILEESDAHITG